MANKPGEIEYVNEQLVAAVQAELEDRAEWLEEMAWPTVEAPSIEILCIVFAAGVEGGYLHGYADGDRHGYREGYDDGIGPFGVAVEGLAALYRRGRRRLRSQR